MTTDEDIHRDLRDRCQAANIDYTLYTHRMSLVPTNVRMLELLGADDGWSYLTYRFDLDDIISNTLPEWWTGSGMHRIDSEPIDRAVTA